jgi:hypothetical protein
MELNRPPRSDSITIASTNTLMTPASAARNLETQVVDREHRPEPLVRPRTSITDMRLLSGARRPGGRLAYVSDPLRLPASRPGPALSSAA